MGTVLRGPGALALLLLGALAAAPGEGAAAGLRLTWKDTSGGEAGFRIERQAAGEAYAELATLEAGVTAYLDQPLVEGATYCYRVQAVNEAGASPYSNEACGRVPGGLVVKLDVEGPRRGTVTSEPAGIACGSDCKARFPSGTVVTLSATPDPRSAFAGWRGGGCEGAGPCTVTGNAPVRVRATFRPLPRHRLTVARSGPGTVTAAPGRLDCGQDCEAAYVEGTAVTLTATPARGARFAGWGGACQGTDACSVVLDGRTAVSATFSRSAGDPDR